MNPHTTKKLPNKFVFDAEDFHPLTFKQRIRILFGYNVLTRIKVQVDKRAIHPVRYKVELFLSEQRDAAGQIKQNLTLEPSDP